MFGKRKNIKSRLSKVDQENVGRSFARYAFVYTNTILLRKVPNPLYISNAGLASASASRRCPLDTHTLNNLN